MKMSYEHIYSYIKEFDSYLEAFKRQSETDYQDLGEKKYQSVNEMFLMLVRLNSWILDSLKDNIEDFQQISFYELDSMSFKRQLIEAQENNVLRLAKFI